MKNNMKSETKRIIILEELGFKVEKRKLSNNKVGDLFIKLYKYNEIWIYVFCLPETSIISFEISSRSSSTSFSINNFDFTKVEEVINKYLKTYYFISLVIEILNRKLPVFITSSFVGDGGFSYCAKGVSKTLIFHKDAFKIGNYWYKYPIWNDGKDIIKKAKRFADFACRS